MTYPTISQYLQALENSKEQLRTIKHFKIIRDSLGEPIFRSSNGSVTFAATIQGKEHSIRLFTSKNGLIKPTKGKVKKNEIYVMGSLTGDYYDLVIEDTTELNPISKNIETKTNIIASENRVAFEKDGKWGFTDNNSQIVIEPQFDSVEEFCEGRTVISLDGMYGLIDINGKIIIEPSFDELSYDGSHLCYVERDGKCGVLDRTARVIVETIWDWTSEFAQGLLLVEKDNLYGYIDLQGKVAIEPKYENATSFDENLYATVRLNGREFQIDQQQHRV